MENTDSVERQKTGDEDPAQHSPGPDQAGQPELTTAEQPEQGGASGEVDPTRKAEQNTPRPEGVAHAAPPNGFPRPEDVAQRIAEANLHGATLYNSAIVNLYDATLYNSAIGNLSARSASTPEYGRAPCLPVQKQDIERIGVLFVEPKPYRNATRILKDNGVLALVGPPSTGKRTAAVRLGAEFSSREFSSPEPFSQMYQFRPAIPWQDLETFPYQEQSIYVWKGDVRKSDLRELDAVLAKLDTSLRKCRARVILTFSGELLLTQGAPLSQYAQSWEVPEDRYALLEGHLNVELSTRMEAARRKQRIEDVLNALRQYLGEPIELSLADITELVQRLVGCVCEECDLQTALFDFRPEGEFRNEVRKWFADHRRLSDRVPRLALTVLDGADYDQFCVWARHLEERITERISGAVDEEGEDDPFVVERKDLEDRWEAIIKPYTKSTGYGAVPAIGIWTRSRPGIRRAVVQRLWDGMYVLQEPFLNWLDDLAGSQQIELQLCAARAIAEAAQYDLDRIVRRFLLPWAQNGPWQLRLLCAITLNLLVALNPDYYPHVLRLVEKWCAPSKDYQLRWIAAVAYGNVLKPTVNLLALPDIDTALENLRAVALSDDPDWLVAPLWHAALSSLHDLFLTGGGPQILAYLTQTKDVLYPVDNGGANRPRSSWFTSLLRLEQMGDDGNRPDLPALLETVQAEGAGQQMRDDVVRLLRAALRSPATQRAALQGIEFWMQRADEQERNKMRTAVGSLLYRVAFRVGKDLEATEEDARRLRHYLMDWSRTSPTASTILKEFYA